MEAQSGGREQWMISAAFLIAEAVLFGWILVSSFLPNAKGDVVRFSMILVCVVYVFARILTEKSRETWFLFLAFVFSAAADYFLIYREDRYLLAVGLFSAAQIFHALRISAAWQWKKGLGPWLLRGLVLLAGLSVLKLLKIRDPLIYLGVFYILNLIFSFTESIGLAASDKRYVILPAGLFLFILCDVTVGLRGMGEPWNLSDSLVRTAASLTYVFYVPSQVLIALAGTVFGKRETLWKIC